MIIMLSCIGSRILTSIFYIEDIDSLRFALSIYEYDLTRLQPHFPGYPIFVFFAKCLYTITGSMGISFSIIGGLSIFIIIFFLLKLNEISPLSIEGLFLTFIVFFNPLLWLMSNRYMPDLFGLGLAIAILYFFINYEKDNRFIYIAYFMSGILSGVRLSYLPLLIIPFFLLIKRHNQRIYLLLTFFVGCLVWLIPMIWITGMKNLWIEGYNHTVGHFMDYGGTAFTNNDWTSRLLGLVESIWADGLGGYWFQRSWQTSILSILLILLIIISVRVLIIEWNSQDVFKMIISCVLVYTIWILFSQNIIYKSRHILPVLIPFFILLTYGLKSFSKKYVSFFTCIIISFCILLFNISITLVGQHRNPTAIAQLKEQLIEKERFSTVISTPLINYYMKASGVNKRFINIKDQKEIDSLSNEEDINNVILIGNFKTMFEESFLVVPDSIFYHNPYVNRMWSKIETFIINNKDQVNK